MASDLVSLMQREREKYLEQRDRARAELEEAERWLHKIDAFLSVEAAEAKSAAGGKSTNTRTRKRREQTTKVRQDILDAVQQNAANGLGAKDLYAMLGPHGHDKGPINAALFQLTKDEALQQSGRRKPYKPGPRIDEVLAALAGTSDEGQTSKAEDEEAA